MELYETLGWANSIATKLSLSLYPDGTIFCTLKYTTLEETKQAAAATTTRENELHEENRFDRMMEMRSMSQYYNNKANKMKLKLFEERNNGETDMTLNAIKGQRKHAKKMVKYYLKQYDELKKEMG